MPAEVARPSAVTQQAPDPEGVEVPDHRRERLLALVLLGAFAMNYPLLQIFSDAVLCLGLPLLYLYLFGIWIVFIFLTALILEDGPRRRQTKQVKGERLQPRG